MSDRTAGGLPLPRTYDVSNTTARAQGIVAAQSALARGQGVLLPVDVQFGMAADAFQPPAVDLLRHDRGRSSRWAPPMMVPSIAALHGIAMVTPQAAALAEAFWPGQLTLICDPQPSLRWGMGDTSGGIAVRMPLHPVALEVLGAVGPVAVVVPGGEPGRDAEAASRAFPSASVLLTGPRCPAGVSTVVDVRSGTPVILRVGDVTDIELAAVAADVASA